MKSSDSSSRRGFLSQSAQDFIEDCSPVTLSKTGSEFLSQSAQDFIEER